MRSVGEAAKTILKSRAEEGETYDQLPAPLLQKSIAVNNSAIINRPGREKTGEDKKPEDKVPTPNAHSREITLASREILPTVDKKIALDGSISLRFISGDVPGTLNQEKISKNTAREIKTKLQENKGT
jgi:hypothetical protein